MRIIISLALGAAVALSAGATHAAKPEPVLGGEASIARLVAAMQASSGMQWAEKLQGWVPRPVAEWIGAKAADRFAKRFAKALARVDYDALQRLMIEQANAPDLVRVERELCGINDGERLARWRALDPDLTATIKNNVQTIRTPRITDTGARYTVLRLSSPVSDKARKHIRNTRVDALLGNKGLRPELLTDRDILRHRGNARWFAAGIATSAAKFCLPVPKAFARDSTVNSQGEPVPSKVVSWDVRQAVPSPLLQVKIGRQVHRYGFNNGRVVRSALHK